MRANGVSLVIFITLVSIAAFSVAQTLPPPPLPTNAPTTVFSAERAVQHIGVIAEQPRPTGSSAIANARDYVLGVLKNLGLETEVQQDGHLVNIVSRIVGTRSSDAVLLTAHLDSVAQSPGATDDGSGVAVLLETARALVTIGPLSNTVMFLFTDFEEGGSIGANAFLDHHPWARDVRIVIGFDAGGLNGPGTLSATSAHNGWLIRQLAHADPYITGSSAITALASSSTDFGHVFKPAGLSGYAFDLYWDHRIHTREDTIENVNLSSLQHQGDHALSLARYYANLDSLANPKEPDAVYFSVLRLVLVSYSSDLAVPLALAVSVIFGSTLLYGFERRILSWGGMGYGAFVMVVGLLLAPWPSLILGRWLPGVPLRLIGRSPDEPLKVGLVVFLALALVIVWYFLSLRIKSVSLPNLTMGALLPILAGMIGTAIMFPALSFALTWPLLFSLLAGVNWFYGIKRQKNLIPLILSLLFSGAVSIVVLGPTILLGLFDQPSLTLLLLGVLCGFLFPQINLILG